MKIVLPSFEELKTDSLYKKIEIAGRTCYKSENLITETSAYEFTKRILSYNHGSVLEHFNLVFKVDEKTYLEIKKLNLDFVKFTNLTFPIVSMNFRAFYNIYLTHEEECLYPIYKYMEEYYPDLIKNHHESSLEVEFLNNDKLLSLTQDEKDMHLLITIKLITDRGVSHELVRHRLASFSQESTRYCNYGKEKFSHEISFVKTYGLTDEQFEIWKKAMENAEKSYFELLNMNAKPETCRSVLPNSLKTEIVTSCNIKEWKLIFELRCASTAHPDIRFLMIDVRNYFKERGYL